MKHPIFSDVYNSVSAQFMTDDRFARKARSPFEAAQLRSDIEAVTKLTAKEALNQIEAGNLSALDAGTLEQLAEKRFSKQLGWWNRLNPFAQAAVKKVARAAIVAAATYLRARFPVLNLVNAGPAVNILRDISQGV